MPVHITQAVQADGSIVLSGSTFSYKDAIKAHGGKWDPAAKTWILPAGTDTSFLQPLPRKKAIRVAPKPREEWTAAEWNAYVAEQYRARRYVVGRCCKHAEDFWEYAMGPTHYRCARHGVTWCNYTGD